MLLWILTMILQPNKRAARSALPDAPTVTPGRSSRIQLASLRRLTARRFSGRRSATPEPTAEIGGRSQNGLVLFAYDGSEHAKAAIRQAGRQLQNGRRAIVLTVPQSPVPFAAAPGVPPVGLEEDIEQEARRVADEGVELARSSGFDAEPSVEQGEPVWQRIVASADEHDAAIVVMGSHGRTGIPLLVMGSVAAATARHTERPVLIAHDSWHPAAEQKAA